MASVTTIPDAVARPLRTTAQAGVAYAITQFVDVFIHHLSSEQFGALVGLLAIVLSAAQNFVESQLGVALLKKLPAADAPVTEDKN